jgi:signal transduction histidine kinase
MKIKNRIKWLYDGNAKVGSLIQILSHDIINPLNLILGFTEVLKEESEDEELPNGILRASRQIQQIINHVKEMQALESGKRELGLSAMDVSKSLENVSFLFEEKAHKKGVSLIIKNELNDSTKVMAEPISFSHQVLNNLVSNAIKFTPEYGEVVIHTYQKGNKVHVNIQDTGIGIPQKLIPNLFRFDVATSRVGTQGESGTGFGLPLVKKYIELYHGEIHVESIESSGDFENDIHGTNFHIILNCA